MWSLRASDIYQGGENEPPMLTETCLAAIRSLDNESAKIYLRVDALNVCAIHQSANSAMTVLYFLLVGVFLHAIIR